jgi:hypothetical protein
VVPIAAGHHAVLVRRVFGDDVVGKLWDYLPHEPVVELETDQRQIGTLETRHMLLLRRTLFLSDCDYGL